MKNKLLVVTMIVALLATTNSSYSKVITKVAPTYQAVINAYIDSYVNSDVKKLKNILSDDALLKMPRADKVNVQDKNTTLDAMRINAAKQDCTTQFEVIAKSDALIIARVDFQYTNFKQQNYITMELNDDKEWKITQVCKIFQNNAPTTTEPVSAASFK